MLVGIGLAAKYLGVSANTLRSYEKKGYIKVHRTLGNQRIYDTAELEKIKENQRIIERYR